MPGSDLVAWEGPADGVGMKVPADGMTVAVPAGGMGMVAPADGVAVDGPVGGVTMGAPAGGVAVEWPADGVAVKIGGVSETRERRLRRGAFSMEGRHTRGSQARGTVAGEKENGMSREEGK